jgi:hypothetical protein
MSRIAGTFVTTAVGGKNVRVLVPPALPPGDPVLSPAAYVEQNARAEVALTRLSVMAELVALSNWLIHAAILIRGHGIF